ncbi:proline-rich protein PRCC [Biomphalaria glabrata]|nr:proline-rich protein PRCC [Biomphalaria glabrata]
MSLGLVAYGASDDSDTSDNEQANLDQNVHAASGGVSGHISDEDDFQTVSSTSAPIFAHLSSSLYSKDTFSNSNSSAFDNDVNSTSLTSLEDLPPPQSKTIDLPDLVEDELEDEVKPKASEMAIAQQPPNKKSKQPVRIIIPSLNEVEDDESDKTTATSTTSKTTGLFSLLPAPMHSVKKEINRPLIPHIITKKPASNKKNCVPDKNVLSSTSDKLSEIQTSANVSTKHMTAFNALTGFESDSEEEENANSSNNFFSLESTSKSSSKASTATATQDKFQIEEISSSGAETSPSLKEAPNRDVSGDSCADVSESESDAALAGPEPGAINDAPLDFMRMNQLRSWPGSSYGFLPAVGLSGPVTPAAYTSFENSLSVPSNSQYNLANTEDENVNDIEQGMMEEDDLMKFMNDKEFQRLQGKRKRGAEEAISFVDANVDDYVDPSEVSKHLTEESSYVSHKNKDNLPTAQQRRKKQITYLAYQAKEREMELKNTWAQNKLTKKQTQSKYGF